jgi:hypothetical protein
MKRLFVGTLHHLIELEKAPTDAHVAVQSKKHNTKSTELAKSKAKGSQRW